MHLHTNNGANLNYRELSRVLKNTPAESLNKMAMAREGVNLSYITGVVTTDTGGVLDPNHLYFESGPHARMTFATLLEQLTRALTKENESDTVTVWFPSFDEYFAVELELITLKGGIQPILTAK